MYRKIGADEAAELNRLITRCELLVNARGVHGLHDGAVLGLYQDRRFHIVMKRHGQSYGLQVDHDGKRVFRVQWECGDDLGHFESSPGTWRSELFATPAAHA